MRPLFVLLATILAVPASADVVHLKNGNTFEGVVSEVTDSMVRIRLEFGEMSLTRDAVSRIERADSRLGNLLERWDELDASPEAGAADWLEMGRRARLLGMNSKAVQAARRAAALDPDLAGLEALFTGLGQAWDESVRRWVPYEDLMHRRGFVLERGEWVSREVLAARSRAAESEARERRAEARDDRLGKVVELLALAQLERLEEERARAATPAVPYGAFPVASFPGYWPGYVGGPIVGRPGYPIRPVHPVRPVHPIHHTQPGGLTSHSFGRFSTYAPSSWSDVARRQPGSIIPLQPTSPPPISSQP